MVRRIKKIVTGVLVFGTILGVSSEKTGVVSRAMDIGNNEAIVQSDYSSKAYSELRISKAGNALIEILISGKLGKTTKISYVLDLQKYNTTQKSWSSIKNWTNSVEGKNRIAASKHYSLQKTGEYRTKLVAKVWNGSNCEKVTTYSTAEIY